MGDSLHRFPRGRVRARVIAAAEGQLSSLPMVLITPVVAAVAGAVVAFVYTPAERVHDGLVETPSLWASLGLAALAWIHRSVARMTGISPNSRVAGGVGW